MACPKCGGTLEPGRVWGVFLYFSTGDPHRPADVIREMNAPDRAAPAYAYPVPPGAQPSLAPGGPGKLVRAGHHVTARAARCPDCGWIEIDREAIEIALPKPRGPRVPWYRRLLGLGGGEPPRGGRAGRSPD